MPERVVALQLLSSYWLAVILPPTLCFSAIYNERSSSASSAYLPYSNHQGRKFGGYKILPKVCKDTSSPEKEAGICMFNYECTQKSGTVIGSCMDGFLYGTCCKLPTGVSMSTFGVQETTSARPYASAASERSTTFMARPHIEHSPQETYLIFKNGTVVQTVNSPEEFLFISKQQAPLSVAHTSPLPAFNGDAEAAFPADRLPYTPTLRPQPGHSSPSQYHGSSHTKPDKLSSFNSIISSNLVNGITITNATKHHTTPSSRDPSSAPTKLATTKSTSHTSSTSRTTDYLSQSSKFNIVSTTFMPSITDSLHHTGAPFLSNKNDYVDEENLIRVPTLSASDPIPSAQKYSPSNTSISHILWLLNDTQAEVVTDEPSTPITQSFYTWLSIQNNPDKGSSPYFDGTSATRPTFVQQQQYTNYETNPPSFTIPLTTMHHIPGPSFHVTPEVKITPKPQNAVSDPAPTVIVLSSVQDTTVPPKKPTLSSLYTSTSSYNVSYHFPTVSSTSKPSQYIKPASSEGSEKPPIYSSVIITAKPSGSSIRPISSYNTYPFPSTPGNVFTAFPTTTSPFTKPIKTTVSSTIQTFGKPKPVTVLNPPTTSPQTPSYMQTTMITAAKPVWGGNVNSEAIVQPSPSYSQAPIPTFTNSFPMSTASFVSVRPAITSSNNGYPYPHDSMLPFPNYPIPPAHLMSNATENIFDFPPVRDPNVNLTAAHHDKPLVTSTTMFGDEEAEGEVTPQFVVDKTMEDKMHVFVEKVVQSLQGNFEDLEKVLVAGESTSNVTVNTGGGPQKKPATPTKRPPTKKPSSKPTTRPKPAITTLPVTTPTVVTKKPTKKPSLATPVVLFQPSSTSQTTILTTNKKPIKVTTTVSISSSSSASPVSSTEEDETTTDKIGASSEEPVDYRSTCGVRPLARKASKTGRIVGGKGATFGEWPWQVLVREATWLGLFTKNKCGGVLITEKYVITAAHCQPGFLANLVAVFGEFDISGEVESKRSVSKNVRRVIVHRQYDAATFENDIALLELESPIQFDTHIVPICMPEDGEDFTGRMATVTGWGRLKYGGGVPSVLQEVQVPVLDNAVCQHMFHTAGHPKVILSSFICAGYANGQRDSCEGDSGGPLMMERPDGHWTLIATVSHGIKCAAPYLPGVYMRTTYYKPWLQTITGVQ